MRKVYAIAAQLDNRGEVPLAHKAEGRDEDHTPLAGKEEVMTAQSNYEMAQELVCFIAVPPEEDACRFEKASIIALLAIADELRALRETLLTRSEGMPLATLTRHDPPGAESRGPRR